MRYFSAIAIVSAMVARRAFSFVQPRMISARPSSPKGKFISVPISDFNTNPSHRLPARTSMELSEQQPCQSHHDEDTPSGSPFKSSDFAEIARGGRAELLLAKSSLKSYDLDYDLDTINRDNKNKKVSKEEQQLMDLAETCRRNYWECGIAHIPNFVRSDVCNQMVQEAMRLRHDPTQPCFYSTEDHTVYQEPHDPAFPEDHPRNALQRSSKWIMDYDRIISQSSSTSATSPLVTLYTSPHLQAFVSYVVRPHPPSNPTVNNATIRDNEDDTYTLYESGCKYNAAYYNIYNPGDGLGWHFDRSEFGVNLELQPADEGGDFELCWNTRSSVASATPSTDSGNNNLWAFDTVEHILKESSESACPLAQRICDPPVGPGSLVFFAGSRNLHRVTPVTSSQPQAQSRVNAIMTYETRPHQKPNAYSLRKFFGR